MGKPFGAAACRDAGLMVGGQVAYGRDDQADDGNHHAAEFDRHPLFHQQHFRAQTENIGFRCQFLIGRFGKGFGSRLGLLMGKPASLKVFNKFQGVECRCHKQIILKADGKVNQSTTQDCGGP